MWKILDQLAWARIVIDHNKTKPCLTLYISNDRSSTSQSPLSDSVRFTVVYACMTQKKYSTVNWEILGRHLITKEHLESTTNLWLLKNPPSNRQKHCIWRKIPVLFFLIFVFVFLIIESCRAPLYLLRCLLTSTVPIHNRSYYVTEETVFTYTNGRKKERPNEEGKKSTCHSTERVIEQDH